MRFRIAINMWSILAFICRALCKKEKWIHREYEHIKTMYIDECPEGTSVQCFITEKADGTNLCLITDGETVKYGSKTEMIAEKKDFYGTQKCRPWLKAIALRIYDGTKKAVDDVDIVY